LGELVANESLQTTAFEFSFDGGHRTSDSVRLEINGRLKDFQIEAYRYRDILLEAEFMDRKLSGKGRVEDPHARLSFDGTIDFQHALTEYDIYTEIDALNLKPLGWLERDSVSIFNTNIHARINGNTLNNLAGHLDADRLSMESSKGQFAIEDLHFSAQGNQTDRRLRIQSNVLDAEIRGMIDLNTITPYFKAVAMRYAPAIGLETDDYNPQTFDLDVNIKSFNAISAFLDPTLVLEDGTTLTAHFSSEDFTAEFQAFSPFVQYQGFNLENLRINE